LGFHTLARVFNNPRYMRFPSACFICSISRTRPVPWSVAPLPLRWLSPFPLVPAIVRSADFESSVAWGRRPRRHPSGVALQFRNSLRPLAIVQIDPGPSEVIQIPPESKTAAGPFETLRFRSRGSIIVVGPLFSSGRMRTQTEDGQLTGDQHFRDEFLIFTSLKSRAGMNCVPACPARRSNQRI
jgi:hypothetical protein